MEQRPGAGLTLHPLLALALLPVLLLELGNKSLVHVPGQFTQRRLLFLLYRPAGGRGSKSSCLVTLTKPFGITNSSVTTVESGQG